MVPVPYLVELFTLERLADGRVFLGCIGRSAAVRQAGDVGVLYLAVADGEGYVKLGLC
jgi:hypothetical protein